MCQSVDVGRQDSSSLSPSLRNLCGMSDYDESFQRLWTIERFNKSCASAKYSIKWPCSAATYFRKPLHDCCAQNSQNDCKRRCSQCKQCRLQHTRTMFWIQWCAFICLWVCFCFSISSWEKNLAERCSFIIFSSNFPFMLVKRAAHSVSHFWIVTVNCERGLWMKVLLE